MVATFYLTNSSVGYLGSSKCFTTLNNTGILLFHSVNDTYGWASFHTQKVSSHVGTYIDKTKFKRTDINNIYHVLKHVFPRAVFLISYLLFGSMFESAVHNPRCTSCNNISNTTCDKNISWYFHMHFFGY